MRIARRGIVCAVLCCSVVAAACGGRVFKPQYEYEEELYLDLDGSATLNLNASVPALVALRGVDLPTDPRAWLDRRKVRALFARPGSHVALSLSRRKGRRFVHVSVEVDDVAQLATIPPFAWSSYQFDRNTDRIDYRQLVGPAVSREIGGVKWEGSELVAFRMHLPSEILFQNSGESVLRGNILGWEQSLAARLRGEPVDIRVQMAPESILYTTLLLFGSTIVAAMAAFGIALWWIARRGRQTDVVESRV